jgi:hypothetical protein
VPKKIVIFKISGLVVVLQLSYIPLPDPLCTARVDPKILSCVESGGGRIFLGRDNRRPFSKNIQTKNEKG